jgi:fused signal recognition particle receptor
MFQRFRSPFKKIFSFLTKTKFSIGSKLRQLFSQKEDASLFEKLEEIFYEADLGVATSADLTEKTRKYLKANTLATFDEIILFLKKELLHILTDQTHPIEMNLSPFVLLIVGANGSGKTTSIAKLAAHFEKEGKKVLIAAADTYRAAAVEQLDLLAKKAHVEIVKSKSGSDPSAVVFDALASAKARKFDLVLIDTAGRLHTKTALMQELEKIKRVCSKQIPNAPHMTLLVLDSTIGQNALDQAKTFHQFTPISGIILTKWDGSAKGGIIVAIKKELNLPTFWIGVGEGLDDLIPFDAEEFADALFSVKD